MFDEFGCGGDGGGDGDGDDNKDGDEDDDDVDDEGDGGDHVDGDEDDHGDYDDDGDDGRHHVVFVDGVDDDVGDDGDDIIDLYMEGASGDDSNGLTQQRLHVNLLCSGVGTLISHPSSIHLLRYPSLSVSLPGRFGQKRTTT